MIKTYEFIPKDLAGFIYSSSYNSTKDKTILSILNVFEPFIKLKIFEEDDVVLGYLVYSIVDKNLYLHFIYTKSAYRKHGIAKSLLSNIMENELYNFEYKYHTYFTYQFQKLCDKTGYHSKFINMSALSNVLRKGFDKCL